MNEIIRSIENEQLRPNLPKFSIGDTVKVQVKVVEGTRERLQAFEGVVIARRNGEVVGVDLLERVEALDNPRGAGDVALCVVDKPTVEVVDAEDGYLCRLLGSCAHSKGGGEQK